MLSSKKQSVAVDVFVCACVHSCPWADMLQLLLSLVKITFYTLKITRCILRESFFCFSRQQFMYISAHTIFSVQYFILMHIKCFFSWISVRWSKSNIFLVLRVQKYCTFFLILSCVFILVPRKARNPFANMFQVQEILTGEQHETGRAAYMLCQLCSLQSQFTVETEFLRGSVSFVSVEQN